MAHCCDDGELPIALVADGISGGALLVRAISHGLVSYLVRGQVDLEGTVGTLVAGSRGRTEIPPQMVKELVARVRVWQRGGSDGVDSPLGELTRRETEVLSLIAEGLITAEIASRLNYAERTIKNVLHTVIVRLHL
ncbi:LuxR C-terminal-related transcriptional regulator [Streptomyces sp. OE57]|uniref:response regulator transcription factor n=1 Tax=Streptomyces lacaronensis TaxID=3379885 RepID=UPI0039B720EE